MATIPTATDLPDTLPREGQQLSEEQFLAFVHRARKVADALEETRGRPRQLVVQLARDHGYSLVKELQREAEQIQAKGGVMLSSGKPRTLGGVFFMLARERLGSEAFNKAQQRVDRYFRRFVAKRAAMAEALGDASST